MEVPEFSHGRWKRRPEVKKEIRDLLVLSREALKARLGSCSIKPISGEALIYFVRTAIADRDRVLLNAAFEALSRLATPQLLSDAWILPPDERHDHAQAVLMQVYKEAQDGGADYAEVNFNHYLKWRSIDQIRKRNKDLEVVNSCLDSTDASKLLQHTMPHSGLSPEDRVLIRMAMARLPRKVREVFLQYHYLGLTQPEIAEQHGRTPQRVSQWLADARKMLGMSGGEHEA